MELEIEWFGERASTLLLNEEAFIQSLIYCVFIASRT